MTVAVVLGVLLLVVLVSAAGVSIGRRLNQLDRERLDARRWKTWQWEQELLSAAEHRGCSGCILLRRRAELLRLPSD